MFLIFYFKLCVYVLIFIRIPHSLINIDVYFQNSEATDDRVRRLESDKDSLQLQVSVLSEQIAAQTEKINDLERLLNEKRNLLANAEELLQRVTFLI